MVSTVKSRAITGLQPGGRVTDEMCTASLMSRPRKSTVTPSGMLSAGTVIRIEWRTRLMLPPFLMPGDSGWLITCTGTSTRKVVPGFRRRKSTCSGVSLTTSSW